MAGRRFLASFWGQQKGLYSANLLLVKLLGSVSRTLSIFIYRHISQKGHHLKTSKRRGFQILDSEREGLVKFTHSFSPIRQVSHHDGYKFQ